MHLCSFCDRCSINSPMMMMMIMMMISVLVEFLVTSIFYRYYKQRDSV